MYQKKGVNVLAKFADKYRECKGGENKDSIFSLNIVNFGSYAEKNIHKTIKKGEKND
jgi:hypothetical protein